MDKKEQQVLATIGLPGSGKSTWAKEQIRKKENWVRIGRDSFREMLKNATVTDPKIEDLITRLQDEAVIAALRFGQNVIVDNTNLKAKYLEKLADIVKFHADLNFMLFDAPAKKCIERDALRPNPVGSGVIMKMDKDMKKLLDSFDFSLRKRRPTSEQHAVKPNFESDKKSAVIFDIDGTLAFMGKRGPYDLHLVDRDDVNRIVAEQTHFHKNAGRDVLIVSGRENVCMDMTRNWLDFYDIKYDHIFMRKANDYRKDSIIKKEIYYNDIEEKWNVLCVYDDRLQVVKAWYEMGLFTFNVNQGMIDF
jgi:predicted kinase